ncbi:DUF3305 domain-containing protein [Oxalobacteraceae bacterium R-40]|uniref:DUF3305 domain-containing protein n=1 Tax=Keguizhuia sedimenti TaxID=3064264 RepID=A0ABU1BQA0_9BURK|nr:DUF3305 domain-containing protein [Oxalobacteraceae bacterium R-40]
MEVAKVGVVMQRTPLSNRWQPFQWRPVEIVRDIALPEGGVRRLRDDPTDARWLFSGFEVQLFTAESEGYYLNISSPVPCWFVMWRMEEMDGSEMCAVQSVTLSYNEAARLMDGGERVDTIPASNDIVALLASFVEKHYRPEPKTKRRKPSFEGGEEVSKMVVPEGGSCER